MNVEPIEAYLADLVGGGAELDSVDLPPEPAAIEPGADVAARNPQRPPEMPTVATLPHAMADQDSRSRDSDPERLDATANPSRTDISESSSPVAQPATNSAPCSADPDTAQAEPMDNRPIVENPMQPMPLAIPTKPAHTPAPASLAANPRLLPARDRDDARAAAEAARTNSAFSAQERNAGPTAHTDAWLAFTLNDQTFAIEVVKSQEVLLVPPVVPVRGTDSALLGLTNLRGLLVPVMDLSIRLKLPPARFDEHSRVIVLEAAGQCLGLKVTSVGDVTAVAQTAIEGLESSLFSNGNRYARGIYRLAGRTMILLSAEELLKG
ncbi:MAG: chemotaxis protein CheW [Xanthomonadaceae bacterium]|nr:chemotaxis protein CheW [Xanthomonadaceae bacterium]